MKRFTFLGSSDFIGDIENNFRARVLLYTLAVMLVLEILGMAASNFVKVMDPPHLVASGGVLAALLGALFCMVGLKKSNYAFWLVSIALVGQVAAYGYLNAGLYSPTAALLLTFPILTVFFMGERGGKWALLVSLALIVGLQVTREHHLLHHPDLVPEQASRVRGIIYALITFLLYLMGRGYDASRRQLQAASVELARISDLGTLADGISHEINNPLTAIVNAVGILKKRLDAGDLTPELKKLAFDNIHIGVSRIVEITQALNMLSRSGQKAPLECTSVGRVVEGALSICRERFAASGIRLIVAPIRSDLVMHCRPAEITNVLSSLLFNGFDAVQGQPQKWIQINARETREGVEIAVSDSGPGVPPAKRKKLFTPFSTTKEPGKGVGLSLFFGRNTLSNHRGRLYLDENEAQTTFVIFVPNPTSTSTTPASARGE